MATNCACLATTRNVVSCMGRSVITVDQIFTPSTSGYTTGDVVAATTSANGLLTFACAVAIPGGSATLVQAQIIETSTSTLAKNALNLIVVGGGAYVTAAENAALNSSTLDPINTNKLCGVVSFANGDYKNIGTTGTYTAAAATQNPNLKVFNADSTASNNIYAYLVYAGASQYAGTASVCVRLTFDRD